MGNTGLNVLCNQEYAQAVPHVSAVHCRSILKFEFFYFHRYITTLYLRPNLDQVRFLVQRLLKDKLPSHMKRCIKKNSSPDMNSTKMMQLCLRKRLEHDYERRHELNNLSKPTRHTFVPISTSYQNFTIYWTSTTPEINLSPSNLGPRTLRALLHALEREAMWYSTVTVLLPGSDT